MSTITDRNTLAPRGAARSLRGRLRAFFRCRSGAGLLEFALGLPVFVLLTAGIFEFALVLFVNNAVEGGLRDASRYGITGQSVSGETREQTLINIVNDRSYGLVTLTASDITFKSYDTLSAVGQEEPYNDNSPANGQYDVGETYTDINTNGQWDADQGADGVGGADDVVLYTVTYQWTFLTPLFAPFGGGDGALDLTSTITVRNEPYS